MSSERRVSPKKFLRTVRKENASKHAGEVFTQSLNTEVVKKEIIEAKRADRIPWFYLNKVELHITGSCNLRCGFCYGKTVVPERRNARLEVSEVTTVLQDIRANMAETEPLVVLAGLFGEPLMHRDIISILDQVGEHRFRFGIYTNGQLLTDDVAGAIGRNAKKNKEGNPPSYISFNVTAMFDEENTRNETDKDKLRMAQLEKISEFSKRKHKEDSPIIINASLLALPGSFDYERIVEELKTAGVDNIRLSFPWLPQTDPRKRVFGGLKETEFEERRKTFSHLRNKYPEKVSVRLPSSGLRHCFVMTQSLAVSPEGDIFPCPEVCSPHFKDTHHYGNILEDPISGIPISGIWWGRQHKSRFFGLRPNKVSCECCHVDRELNEELARYWEECSVCESTAEEDPVGVFEWQWAGENWYGKVVLEQEDGVNSVAMTRVGRLQKKVSTDGTPYFSMGELVLDLTEGEFEILDARRIRMKLKVKKLDQDGKMKDEDVEGVLTKTECFAGNIEYSNLASGKRSGGMVIVKRESIKDESVQNWFLDPPRP